MSYKANNPHQESLSSTLESIGGKVIAFRSSWARRLGSVHTALVLQQLIYEGQLHADEEGWFFITADDMEESTAVGRDAYRMARTTLVSIGIIESQRRGIPAKTYIRFDTDTLNQWLHSSTHQDCVMPQSGLRDSADSTAETRNVITREKQELIDKKVGADAPTTRKKASTHVPQDFSLTDGLIEWGKSRGWSKGQMEGQVEGFVDHHTAEGNKKADWSAAFRTWMRNAEKWGHLNRGTPVIRTATSTNEDPYLSQMLAHTDKFATSRQTAVPQATDEDPYLPQMLGGVE